MTRNRLSEIEPGFGPEIDPNRPPRKEIPDVGQLRMGMWVFLASLGMLFVSSLVGYVFVRKINPSAAPVEPLEIPGSLAVSTAILLVAGFTFHRCQRLARHRNFESAEKWLLASAVFTVGFLVVQVPGMLRLLIHHQISMRGDVGYYGLTLSLVVLHALHVIGGLVPLTWLVVRTLRVGINSSHVRTIRMCSLYWHFLEIVWIVMYGTLLIVR